MTTDASQTLHAGGTQAAKLDVEQENLLSYTCQISSGPDASDCLRLPDCDHEICCVTIKYHGASSQRLLE